MSILVCGLAVIDLVFSVDTIPTRPNKYPAHDMVTVGGGCAANAAVAIVRLGGQAALVARVGNDLVGDMIVSGLEAEGVDCGLVQRHPGSRSPVSAVLVDRTGERLVVNYRARHLPDDVSRAAEAGALADAVLVDTRWPAVAVAALEAARGRGVAGVVDAEAPIPFQVASAASHVVFSQSGLGDFTGVDQVEEALGAADRLVSGWVAVTLGGDGTLVLDRGLPTLIPAPTVEVVDTLGAGDVWHGAFTLALAEGRPEVEAVRFANAAAALKCTGPGGRAATLDRSAVLALLSQST